MAQNPDDFKLVKKVFIEGTMTLLTGLHIGGSSVGMAIGGVDAVVIRNPLSDEPYVPGSSLKGKMRSLMEKARGEMKVTVKETVNEGGKNRTKREKFFQRLGELTEEDLLPKFGGKISINAGPSNIADTDIGKLFGVSADNESARPTRLIVRDAHLTKASRIALQNARNTDMPMTEVKTEVVIDRITSMANPRQLERVPSGAVFKIELVLNLYGNDDRQPYLDLIWEGLELVQADFLGGKGSRGSGKVKFVVTQVQEKDMGAYRTGAEAVPLNNVNIYFALRGNAHDLVQA